MSRIGEPRGLMQLRLAADAAAREARTAEYSQLGPYARLMDKTRFPALYDATWIQFEQLFWTMRSYPDGSYSDPSENEYVAYHRMMKRRVK